MVWECLLRKIVVIFSGRQDVNHSQHVAIINLLLGWEMLSDNDMCSFPGSQESSHGDICQHAVQTYSDLTCSYLSVRDQEEWNDNNFLLWVFECFLPLNSLSPAIDVMCPVSDREWWLWPSGMTLPLPMMGWPRHRPNNTWWAHRDNNYPPTHCSHSDTCNHLISWIISHTSLVTSVISSVRKRCGRWGQI